MCALMHIYTIIIHFKTSLHSFLGQLNMKVLFFWKKKNFILFKFDSNKLKQQPESLLVTADEVLLFVK